jgi:3-methyladenine DNA glycosylase Tag
MNKTTIFSPNKCGAPMDEESINKLLQDAENLRNELKRQNAAADAAVRALEKQIEHLKEVRNNKQPSQEHRREVSR